MNALTPHSDVIELSPENLSRLLSQPLFAIPAELRPGVWMLWQLQQHIIPNPLSVTSALAYDIANGLSLKDAAAIIRGLCDAQERYKYKFASDFMCELANRTSIAIKRNAKLREQLERRKEMETPMQADAHKTIVNDLADKFGVKQ